MLLLLLLMLRTSYRPLGLAMSAEMLTRDVRIFSVVFTNGSLERCRVLLAFLGVFFPRL